MIFKTQGIVLNYVKFRDTSIIVKIYTEAFGLKTYIVNGVRSTKAKSNKIAYYQPLTLLDLVIYNRENKDINRISEVKVLHPYHSIPFDHKKNLVAIFLTEVLVKLLKEAEQDTPLFNFVKKSIIYFDQQAVQFENFHIQFLIQLTHYLGFAPQKPADFCNFPGAENALEQPFFLVLKQLFANKLEAFVNTTGKVRTQILEFLLKFYQYHIAGFGEIKSLQIIKELH